MPNAERSSKNAVYIADLIYSIYLYRISAFAISACNRNLICIMDPLKTYHCSYVLTLT